MVAKPGDVLQHLAQLPELGVLRPDLDTVRMVTKTTSVHMLEAMFDDVRRLLLHTITSFRTSLTDLLAAP